MNVRATPTTRFRVELVKNEVMLKRWEDIETALRAAFEGSNYVDTGYDIKNPVGYTLAGVEGRLRRNLGHVLALDIADRVLGGIFCIPTQREETETTCDVGWVFVMPDVGFRVRLELMDAMMMQVYKTVSAAGFLKVVTNMGTFAGVSSITRRYGIIHEPTEAQPNRWTRDLQ